MLSQQLHRIVHEWSALHDVLKSRGQAVIFVLGDVNNRDLDPDLRHYKTYTKKETVKRFVMSELCQ